MTTEKELIEALQPFAAMNIKSYEDDDDDLVLFVINHGGFTLGDVRKAKKILEEMENG